MSNQMVKGNTAVVIGAMYAGCDCFFGYPITPASEILHEASKYFPMVGRNFVQAESEEASINMVYGASGTGHRVMTSSSLQVTVLDRMKWKVRFYLTKPLHTVQLPLILMK